MPDIIKYMESIGAIKKGHFVYQSGLHGDTYLRKDLLGLDVRRLNGFCYELVQRSQPFDVMVAPVVGALIPGSYAALNQASRIQNPVALCYAEKNGDGFVLKRGFDKFIKDREVTVSEDILTTGDTVNKVIAAINECGGAVTQILGLVNRNPTVVTSERFGGIPIVTLAQFPLKSWREDECPLCKEGVPINEEFGHGTEFLARQSA